MILIIRDFGHGGFFHAFQLGHGRFLIFCVVTRRNLMPVISYAPGTAQPDIIQLVGLRN